MVRFPAVRFGSVRSGSVLSSSSLSNAVRFGSDWFCSVPLGSVPLGSVLSRAGQKEPSRAGAALPSLEVSLVAALPLPRPLIILLKGTILPFRLECLILSGVLEKDIVPP